MIDDFVDVLGFVGRVSAGPERSSFLDGVAFGFEQVKCLASGKQFCPGERELECIAELRASLLTALD